MPVKDTSCTDREVCQKLVASQVMTCAHWPRTMTLCLMAFLMVVLFPCHGGAQQTGIQLFSTQTGSEFESFNLANGNIMYHLPVRTKSGPIPININYRGSFQLTPQLQGAEEYCSGGCPGPPTPTYWDLVQWGLPPSSRAVGSMLQVAADPFGATLGVAVIGSGLCDPGNPYSALQWTNYYLLSVTDSTGAVHSFGDGEYEYEYDECNNTTYPIYPPNWSSAQTTDGSGYVVMLLPNSSDNLALFDKSGDAVNSTYNNYSIITPNNVGFRVGTPVQSGNSWVFSYTDAYNMPVWTNTSTFTAPGAGTKVTTYTGGSGEAVTVTPQSTQYTLQTAFGCSYPQDRTPISTTLPSSISISDSASAYDRAYTFAYEPTPGQPGNVTGRLAGIGLPTGGSITYTYSGGNNNAGVICQPSLEADPAIGMGILSPVVTRTVNDGNGHSSIWTYSFSTPTVSNQLVWLSTTTVTDPIQNVSVYSFVNGYQTEVQSYNGPAAPANLLKTVITCYLGNFLSCANPPPSGIPYGIAQTDVYTSYNNSGIYSMEETSYNSFGLPTDVKEYDFGTVSAPNGSGPTGTPLKETQTTYGSYAQGGCTGIFYPYVYGTQTLQVGIYDRPCDVKVYSSGTLVSETRNTYDAHGNVLSTASMANPTSWVTQTYTYGSNGATLTSTDGNGIPTQYQNFTCNGLLPQTISKGGLTWGEGWDCNSGLMSSSTGPAVGSSPDPNEVTYYKYNDPLFRPNETDYPDGGQTRICYSDVGGALCSPSANANIVTTQTIASPNPSLTSVVTSDGLGRPLYTLLPSGAYTANGYNLIGQVCATSNPSVTAPPGTGLSCSSNQNPVPVTSTDGITYFQYDALGRTSLVTEPDGNTQSWSYNGNGVLFTDENQNQWQRTYNALGNMTKVLEPNGSGPSPSMETDYSYDALNNLLSVTQKGNGSATITRKFAYNGLSWLLAANNPENASAANAPSLTCAGAGSAMWTTCYGYDQNGNVTSRKNNRSVTTTFTYDGLNRITTKTYSDGITQSSCYVYGTLLHGADKLGAEWTQSGSCSSTPPTTPTTNQSMRVIGAYDYMERVLSEMQCVSGFCTTNTAPPSPPAPPSAPGLNCTSLPTPNGLGYCYDLAGNLLAYSNGLNSTTYPYQWISFSQVFDGSGRPSGVTSSGNVNSSTSYPLFTAAQPDSYTPFNAPQSWQLGTRLAVSRSYDNRQRPTGLVAVTH